MYCEQLAQIEGRRDATDSAYFEKIPHHQAAIIEARFPIWSLTM